MPAATLVATNERILFRCLGSSLAIVVVERVQRPTHATHTHTHFRVKRENTRVPNERTSRDTQRNSNSADRPAKFKRSLQARKINENWLAPSVRTHRSTRNTQSAKDKRNAVALMTSHSGAANEKIGRSSRKKRNAVATQEGDKQCFVFPRAIRRRAAPIAAPRMRELSCNFE